MRGVSVTVSLRRKTGVDEGNNAVYKTVSETVDDVLILQGDQDAASGNVRPDGIVADATAYFPKTFQGSLRGAMVTDPAGREYKVVGDPFPPQVSYVPTKWNLKVPLTRTGADIG
ncbi:hypothetical protein [Bifidobacterium psychraerophilum]|uniref:hypothetical protein n=1 Tax=Bifidobacterium psychraerophilum TaxID=218140 RepID=UPI0039EC3EEA